MRYFLVFYVLVIFNYLFLGCRSNSHEQLSCEEINFNVTNDNIEFILKGKPMIDIKLSSKRPYPFDNYESLSKFPELISMNTNFSLCNFIDSCEADSGYVQTTLPYYKFYNEIIEKLNLKAKDSTLIKCIIEKSMVFLLVSDSIKQLNAFSINSLENLNMKHFKSAMEDDNGFDSCLSNYQMKTIKLIKSQFILKNNCWYFVSNKHRPDFKVFVVDYNISGDKLRIEKLDVLNPAMITYSSLFKW